MCGMDKITDFAKEVLLSIELRLRTLKTRTCRDCSQSVLLPILLSSSLTSLRLTGLSSRNSFKDRNLRRQELVPLNSSSRRLYRHAFSCSRLALLSRSFSGVKIWRGFFEHRRHCSVSREGCGVCLVELA